MSNIKTTSSILFMRSKCSTAYIDCGLRLGWLINPQDRQVEIYRANQLKQFLQNPEQIDGEDVLPDFVFDLAILWG